MGVGDYRQGEHNLWFGEPPDDEEPSDVESNDPSNSLDRLRTRTEPNICKFCGCPMRPCARMPILSQKEVIQWRLNLYVNSVANRCQRAKRCSIITGIVGRVLNGEKPSRDLGRVRHLHTNKGIVSQIVDIVIQVSAIER